MKLPIMTDSILQGLYREYPPTLDGAGPPASDAEDAQEERLPPVFPARIVKYFEDDFKSIDSRLAYRSHSYSRDADSELVDRCFRGRQHYYNTMVPSRKAWKRAREDQIEQMRQYRSNVQYYLVAALVLVLGIRFLVPEFSSPIREISCKTSIVVVLLLNLWHDMYIMIYPIPKE